MLDGEVKVTSSEQLLNKATSLASLLMDVQAQLYQLNLWRQLRPSEQALSSQQPFCIDTLNFPQWLQFIFIERMGMMLEQKMALPTNCQIAPMAEEFFKAHRYPSQVLIGLLRQVDELLTEG